MNVKFICIGSGFREVPDRMRVGDVQSLPIYINVFRDLKVSAKYDDTIAAEVPKFRVRNYRVHEVRGVPQGTPWNDVKRALKLFRWKVGRRTPLVLDVTYDYEAFFGKGRN